MELIKETSAKVGARPRGEAFMPHHASSITLNRKRLRSRTLSEGTSIYSPAGRKLSSAQGSPAKQRL